MCAGSQAATQGQALQASHFPNALFSFFVLPLAWLSLEAIAYYGGKSTEGQDDLES